MLEQSKVGMKAEYNWHRHDNTKHELDEILVMSTVSTHTGQSTKYQNKYRGPLTVTEILPGDVYRVVQLQEYQKRQFTTPAHIT